MNRRRNNPGSLDHLQEARTHLDEARKTLDYGTERLAHGSPQGYQHVVWAYRQLAQGTSDVFHVLNDEVIADADYREAERVQKEISRLSALAEKLIFDALGVRGPKVGPGGEVDISGDDENGSNPRRAALSWA